MLEKWMRNDRNLQGNSGVDSNSETNTKTKGQRQRGRRRPQEPPPFEPRSKEVTTTERNIQMKRLICRNTRPLAGPLRGSGPSSIPSTISLMTGTRGAHFAIVMSSCLNHLPSAAGGQRIFSAAARWLTRGLKGAVPMDGNTAAAHVAYGLSGTIIVLLKMCKRPLKRYSPDVQTFMPSIRSRHPHKWESWPISGRRKDE